MDRGKGSHRQRTYVYTAAVVDFDGTLYLGKPSEAAARAALDHLDASADDVLVVGDRVDTDVALARRMSVDAALVRTGVGDEASVRDAGFEPEHVLDSVSDAVGLFERG